jgi:large subunit ribosomal protein L9
MEIILRADVKNLGYKNDIVTVKNGYGLNFLIPQGMGSLATDSAKKVHAENLKQSAHKEVKVRATAEALAAQLATVSVKVGAKAGENGKIFGAVTAIQIADALKKLGHDIDRKNLTIEGDSIKALGEYVATARLHKDITASIKFEVVAE